MVELRLCKICWDKYKNQIRKENDKVECKIVQIQDEEERFFFNDKKTGRVKQKQKIMCEICEKNEIDRVVSTEKVFDLLNIKVRKQEVIKDLTKLNKLRFILNEE